MASINKCMFIGNCGRDPEVRSTQAGDKVANVSIACSEKFKNAQGEKVERTEWIRLVAWRKLAELFEKYVRKGDPVYVETKCQTRSWDDEGQTKYITEFVVQSMQLLGRKKDSDSGNHASGGPDGDGAPPAPKPEDDLPF